MGSKKLYHPQKEEKYDIADDWGRHMKPGVLVIKKRSDIDQVVRDWKEYIGWFETYLQVTNIVGIHENPEKEGAPCRECRISKTLLQWTGGPEACMIVEYVGKVEWTDNWKEAQQRIKRGIKRYRLMKTMQDGTINTSDT